MILNRYATIASYYIYLIPYCHTILENNLFRYLEVEDNTCTTILTHKQSIYFLQYKYEYQTIIYMNNKNTNNNVYTIYRLTKNIL